jgi:lipopolysaccharide heptosyltransferase II
VSTIETHNKIVSANFNFEAILALMSAGRLDLELDSGWVLIVLHGSIGDVVRGIPLANLLKRHRPALKVAWSVEPPAAPLLQAHPAIDDVITFDRYHWARVGVGYLKDLSKRKFDLVLDLQRHFKSGLIGWCTRAPVRVGFGRSDAKEGNWLFNTHHVPARKPGQSKLSMYLEFGAMLGIPTDPIEWRLSLRPNENDRVAMLLSGIQSPFAAFFVGSRWPSKRWTPEATAMLIDLVRDGWGLKTVLLGGEFDTDTAERIASLSRKGIWNLAGRTSLRDLIGILERSVFSLGPDTGTMHLSAAVGTPVVSLWAPSDPEWSGPFGNEDLIVRSPVACGPCMSRICGRATSCMAEISPDQVMIKIERVLKKKALES